MLYLVYKLSFILLSLCWFFMSYFNPHSFPLLIQLFIPYLSIANYEQLSSFVVKSDLFPPTF